MDHFIRNIRLLPFPIHSILVAAIRIKRHRAMLRRIDQRIGEAVAIDIGGYYMPMNASIFGGGDTVIRGDRRIIDGCYR